MNQKNALTKCRNFYELKKISKTHVRVRNNRYLYGKHKKTKWSLIKRGKISTGQ